MKFRCAGSSAHRGLPRGLGQHPGLQRQQVAEDAREGHHHVDPRPAKLGQRDQVGTRQPAIAVEARPGSHQRQRLGDRAAVGLDVVRPPQHQRHRNAAGVGWVSSRSCACRAPSRSAKAVGIRNGSKAWMLRPVGRISGERIRSPARNRGDEAPAQRTQQRRDLGVSGQMPRHRRALRVVGPGEDVEVSGHRLGVRLPAQHMQPVRDQGVLGFQQLEPEGRGRHAPRGRRPPPARPRGLPDRPCSGASGSVARHRVRLSFSSSRPL